MNDNTKNFQAVASMVTAIDNTGIRMFMYYPQSKTITVPENTCKAYQCKPFYDNMPHSFADDYVSESDYSVFKNMYYEIDRGAKTATAVFHSKDLKYCNHVTLTTISWTEDGQPKEAFGLIEDESELYRSKKLIDSLKNQLDIYDGNPELDEALRTIALAVGSQYYAMYYIWIPTRKYICFQEQLEGILEVIGKKGDYEPAWDKYIKGYIEKKDQEKIREFIDITTLAERIGSKKSISYTYRRRGIGWTRGQFIVGKRDENGMPLTVIYTVTDINEEIEAKVKKQEAELEAMQDPLTGLWNRKAFDEFKLKKEYQNKPTTLVLFDIDRFKAVNDQYGHSQGDRVLKIVAQEVLGVLRQKDSLFRFGGDEFAILLYDTDVSVWRGICKKIETMHNDVKRLLPMDTVITISAGMCINKNGYCDEMFELVDRAMYNTKANGRGGCTLIDYDGKILNEWHDNSSFLRKGDVLEKNSTVTWRLDKPKKDGKPFRVYGDEMFTAFVGLTNSATPESLYRAWQKRVKPDNMELLSEATNLAINDGRVEVVFDWNHPEKGMIKLRCSASLESENDDYYTFIGYIHVITGVHVATIEDIDSKIKNAIEELYYCNFYIRLNDYSYTIHKAQPYMIKMLEKSDNAIDSANIYVKYSVADESKALMAEYLDFTTLKDRMKDVNVLKQIYKDNSIGWAKAKLVVVDRDDDGAAKTVALLVEPTTS